MEKHIDNLHCTKYQQQRKNLGCSKWTLLPDGTVPYVVPVPSRYIFLQKIYNWENNDKICGLRTVPVRTVRYVYEQHNRVTNIILFFFLWWIKPPDVSYSHHVLLLMWPTLHTEQHSSKNSRTPDVSKHHSFKKSLWNNTHQFFSK